LLNARIDPTQRNKSGSTPLHLAVQTTGASGGSGSIGAQRRQKIIIQLLLKHGAKLTDQDFKGKTVEQSAKSVWGRELLAASQSG
jgi:ankyrin repeat protein